MRAVLYSSFDLEPITILSIDPYIEGLLKERGRVSMPVYDIVRVVALSYNEATQARFRTVEIISERLVIHGKQTRMLFTANDESALLLQSVFLPGQYKEVQKEREKAKIAGMVSVIDVINKIG